MADFLLEIGLEEVPARMLAAGQQELARRVQALLIRERLFSNDASNEVTSYSTPRRLAVFATGLRARQEDSEESLQGPAVKVAFKDGQPTPAAVAFAKKAGVDVSELKTQTTARGEYVTAMLRKPGQAAADVLAGELPAEIAGIYWAKSMYWRPGKPERFVRPVRWLVALFDESIVPLEFAGIKAGAESRGHRILYGSAPVTIAKPAEYATTLGTAFVMVDPEQRRQKIRKALDAATRTVNSARWREDEALVDQTVHLTEWPSVLLGSFENEHLSLPEEVLVTVMRDHQKYFAVEDAHGRLSPHFLAVLNTEVDESGAEIIRQGNARVLRSRFNDARFFWNIDQKILLEQRVELLKSVTFQKQLGSYWEKTQANMRVAQGLLEILAAKGARVNGPDVELALKLAKTDLTTELVKEFTELQGIVGGLYAAAQGMPPAVAQAIYEQYMPAGMDDACPRTSEAALVGLADRANTIVDMFAIGLAPTGSKDPFALRRAGNGIVRILASDNDAALPLTLVDIVSAAMAASDQSKSMPKQYDVLAFLRERLAFYLREVLGFAYDVVNAVTAVGADDVRDTIARAQAVTAVRGTSDFAAISIAFKRMKNILTQADSKGETVGATLNVALLTPGAEVALHAQLLQLAPEVEALRQRGDYAGALDRIATLRPPVDAFFEGVMVLAPEADLRANRLALLKLLLADFSRIADFSEIVPAA
jgi:glycyl-tRNA synthetase beta chain